MREALKSPFPWFGGKSRVSGLVWDRFGDVPNYVEPFFGSGAVLFGRPTAPGTETINDKDGYIVNFWRAIKHDPGAVAHWAANPVQENELHARHAWLITRKDSLRQELEGDPEFCDPKVAGWWVWGISCWIGSGFCSGNGPWQVRDRQLLHLGNKGRGVNRQLVHLGDKGRGVNRQLVHLWDKGRALDEYFAELSRRLAGARICSGEWDRIVGPSVTSKHGITGVFLDPPYSAKATRKSDLYTEDCDQVGASVAQWAAENGGDPLLRIAVCGYEGEHVFPGDWESVAWKNRGGYGSQGSGQGRENSARERIWFSPNCLHPKDDLFSLDSMGADA